MTRTIGWPRLPLSELCEPVAKADPQTLGRKEFRYIDISSIDRADQRVTAPQRLPVSDAPTRARQIVKAGDVLFSTVRPNLRTIAPVPLNLDNEVASTGFCVLRPSPKLLPEFLLYAVSEERFNQRIESKARGVSYPAVRPPDVLEESIAVPSLEDQARICSGVGAAFAQLRTASEELRKAQRLSEVLLDVALRTMFWNSDGSTRWNQRQLSELCDTSSGGTPSRKNPDFFGTDIPWIKIGDLNDGLVETVEEGITAEGLAGSSAKLVPSGTLMIAMYGASIGRLGITDCEAATNQAICSFAPKPNCLESDYLYWFLRASRQHLIAAGYGGAQPNISQKLLRALPIPTPSLMEQRRVAADARDLSERIRATGRAIGEAETTELSLRRSILESALAGSLG